MNRTTAGLRLAILAGALVLGAPGSFAATAPEAEPVHLHTVTQGETVIALARRFLVDPAGWPELAQANQLRDANRIAPGLALRIPLRLMRSTPVSATLVSVTGQGQTEAAARLQVGQPLAEGSVVSTGADGHLTIRLVDGTVLRLRPDSRLQLRESRELKDMGAVRSGVVLDRGRVEVEAAPAPPGRAGFSIRTPQGVLGVRGTEFRVAVDDAVAATATTRGEVLGGRVAVSGRAGSESVAAGFGTVVDTSGRVAPPVALLPPPGTAALPVLQEHLLMRFPLEPVAGAASYRGQLASDARFDRVLADLTTPTPELRFGGLPDGDYVLRLRAIDGLGLEGRDVDHRFRLKARPEAPLPAAPAPRAVISGSRADLSWAANAEADRYRVQVAVTPDFKTALRDIGGLRQLSTQLDALSPGVYHWRVASVRADGDQGPWGDPRAFELRPPPAAPSPPVVSDGGVAFAWESRPGQTFEFQLARDASFAALVLERKLTQPAVTLALPGTGRFFVRLRAIDADGFVGPYTTAQHFDVPNCVRTGNGACVRVGDQTLNLAP